MGDPVADIVQASGTDVEDGAVKAAEFWIKLKRWLDEFTEGKKVLTPCVEPVGSEEHGEEKDDHWICLQRHE